MSFLIGKTALVTGGASGVGAATALALLACGARVIVTGRSKDKLVAFAKDHDGVFVIPADVTSEDEMKALFETAGKVDIVVANAGAAESASFGKTDIDAWNRMLAVNLTGVFLTFREGLRQMNGWGRLISIASTAGLKGYGYVVPYCAAKHGVIGLTKALAVEVAKSDVTVNALCPGFIETPMLVRSIENIMEKTGMGEEEARRSLLSGNPQKRFIQPEEVAAAVVNLCRDGSQSINGQALAIAGGEI